MPNAASRAFLCGSLLIFMLIGLGSAAQVAVTPPAQPSLQKTVFVFLQRTSRHAKYSSSEVFQSVVSDVQGYLKNHNVVLAVDEFGGRNFSENEMPLETPMGIARESGASFMLYIVVDRPATKWIKLSARCYDMAGNTLWEEVAESGGGFSGAHGLRVGLEKLHQRLDTRIGQTGLPLATQAAAVQP